MSRRAVALSIVSAVAFLTGAAMAVESAARATLHAHLYSWELDGSGHGKAFQRFGRSGSKFRLCSAQTAVSITVFWTTTGHGSARALWNANGKPVPSRFLAPGSPSPSEHFKLRGTEHLSVQAPLPDGLPHGRWSLRLLHGNSTVGYGGITIARRPGC